MSRYFDDQIPPRCEDEMASANQYIIATAYQFSVEPADVISIAQSENVKIAGEYIDNLKLLFFDLRDVDTNLLIVRSVHSYNQTATLIGFGEAVTIAMRKWEQERNFPEMSIWSGHPSDFDSLRTYVWAQASFRAKVMQEAARKLTRKTELGAYADPKPQQTEISLISTPVIQLLEWIECEYKEQLGIFPIPG